MPESTGADKLVFDPADFDAGEPMSVARALNDRGHPDYWWPRDHAWMGKADWQYQPDLDIHMPCCTRKVGHFRCGNGPLVGEQIGSGDCGEHDLVGPLSAAEEEAVTPLP
jgi:hypothetical protein